jgi:putative SOS response-associated peptidase YedK
MCGRFFQTSSPEEILRVFGTVNLPNLPARYNIAPTTDVAAVRFNPKTNERRLDLLRWGLIPHWSKDAKGGAKMINARAETVATNGAFKDAFERRRCLIPSDGFYEWRKEGKERLPYVARLKGGGLYAFAGLWENWKQGDGTWLRSCAIITTTANAICAEVHERMPVFLDPPDFARWLGEEAASEKELLGLLKPYPEERMEVYRVGPAVGNVKNDDPSLLEPLVEAQAPP